MYGNLEETTCAGCGHAYGLNCDGTHPKCVSCETPIMDGGDCRNCMENEMKEFYLDELQSEYGDAASQAYQAMEQLRNDNQTLLEDTVDYIYCEQADMEVLDATTYEKGTEARKDLWNLADKLSELPEEVSTKLIEELNAIVAFNHLTKE